MRSQIARLALILIGTYSVARAAAIDGTWIAAAPDGKQSATLILKSSGNQLTGSLQIGQTRADLTDGTIRGDEISFKAVRNDGKGGGNFKGTLKGDELTLTPADNKQARVRVFKRAR